MITAVEMGVHRPPPKKKQSYKTFVLFSLNYSLLSLRNNTNSIFP